MSAEATVTQNGADTAAEELTRGGPFYRPNVDIYELPEELVVLADVPGTSNDQIDINFEDGVLIIHAKVTQRQSGQGSYNRREYGVGDIYELPEELVVLADVPGTSNDQIDINFEDGVLTIHAKVTQRQSGQGSYNRREYGVGDFYRTFKVSEQIDASRIGAEYSAGVLTLHLPKIEAAKPRKIKVNAN